MRMLNLGILAHVDAGKTSLTERLLFDAGAIESPGAVDDGTTRTDTMELERRRGITIRTAVATFTRGGHEIHLIDTPGHADFIAEVERALGVLDGAVLVVSAVEGVQAQTRVLMRTLRALGVPTVLFVNKIDRLGARPGALLTEIRRTLAPAAVAVTTGTGAGTRAATVQARPVSPEFTAELAELVAEHDDAVLASYLYQPESLRPTALRRAFAALCRAGHAHPVFFGSAVTGAGVPELLDGIPEFLPAAAGRATDPLSGTVFALEREAGGGRSAVVRLFAGALRTRDTVTFTRRDATGTQVRHTGRVTGVRTAAGTTGRVEAGGIARLTGLAGIRVGDRLGAPGGPPDVPRLRPPTLETVVTADDPGALFAALHDLAEQDPLIDVRRGAAPGSLVVSLYGEVQREVIAARLAGEFGVAARFTPPRVVCVERVTGRGAAVEEMMAGPDGFWATIGLRVEPGPAGSGVGYRLAVERGSLPRAFLTAIEDTVHATLREGLAGWPVTDCRVTLTHTGYASPLSTAADFRGLTPLVLMAALRRAGTVVCEPLERVELTLPPEVLRPVLTVLGRCGGIPGEPVPQGDVCTVEAVLPAARLRELDRALPALTGGAAALVSRFDGYRPAAAPVPVRPRTDANPLDRAEYLLHLRGSGAAEGTRVTGRGRTSAERGCRGRLGAGPGTGGRPDRRDG